MIFLAIAAVVTISYLKIGANGLPITKRDIGEIPVEVATSDTIYWLPKTLKEYDEINVTGKISNKTEWWWAVSLLIEDEENNSPDFKNVACEVKGNKTSNTITINSKIEDAMDASGVFTDFVFIIQFRIVGQSINVRLRESGVEEVCQIDTNILERIKYLTFGGNIEKVEELRFKLA